MSINQLNEEIENCLNENKVSVKKDYFQREIKPGDVILRIRPGFHGVSTSINVYKIEEILTIDNELKFKVKGKQKPINGSVSAIDVILDKEGI